MKMSSNVWSAAASTTALRTAPTASTRSPKCRASVTATYSLKNLKRATIVGETTGGGAHPITPRRLNDHFSFAVPSSRYTSPVTKTNWEDTGVEPDIKVPAAHALKIAQLAALKKLAANKGDAKAATQLKALIEMLQKEVDELKLKKESSKS
jgi:C-terminal processing protease CtpA/Prc